MIEGQKGRTMKFYNFLIGNLYKKSFMKRSLQAAIIGFIAIGFYPAAVSCQPITAASKGLQPKEGLFSNEEVLPITLSGNIKELINDRSDIPKYHPVQLSYKAANGTDFLLRTFIKTRGHFRKLRENCVYPPLSIHFPKSDTLSSSLFKKQIKIKLVMPCQGDEFVVMEWLTYKIYNLITPKSFRARLVSVKMEDIKNKKTTTPFYGILLEDELKMAKRNGSIVVTKKTQPEQTETEAFLKMALFQYLIGNTDWSVQYLQNIKLLAPDSTKLPIAVPYDFDHSGLVNAPYAKPFELLEMNTVRERRYRGYCIREMSEFASAISLFNGLKEDIYRIISDCKLLDAKYKKSTLRYFDEFYTTINNQVSFQKEFSYPCDKKGTGNVVIKGLKED
jgi:hypothetical protein